MRGSTRLHPTSTRFLQIDLQEPTYDCAWRDDVHNRPTFFDIGGAMSRQSMEKDCLPGYRTGAINAFTRGEAEVAARGHLLVGMRHISSNGGNDRMHRYDISDYDAKNKEDPVADFLKRGH